MISLVSADYVDISRQKILVYVYFESIVNKQPNKSKVFFDRVLLLLNLSP